MTTTITFKVWGIPQPQGSMRAFARKGGGFPIVTSDNPKLKNWRSSVILAAADAFHGTPYPGAVTLGAMFYLPRPKVLGTKIAHHVKRPDLDKLARAIGDALTNVLYVDDCQITSLVVGKFYADPGDDPHVVIVVSPTLSWPLDASVTKTGARKSRAS